MLLPRIVPCLDCRDGRVVKGVRFRELRDAGDPAQCAQRYADDGADELVLLDVAATIEARGTALATVAAVRAVAAIPLTVGGGVRDVAAAERLLAAGADKVAVNSAAVRAPELLAELAARFGSQCVVLAIDAAATGQAVVGAASGWEVVVDSGRTRTGLDVVAWARTATVLGAGEILLTSVDRDGTRSGYDLELLQAVRAAVAVPVIASGGARHAADLGAALTAGADAVLIASILHDGDTTVATIKQELQRAGIEVRP